MGESLREERERIQMAEKLGWRMTSRSLEESDKSLYEGAEIDLVTGYDFILSITVSGNVLVISISLTSALNFVNFLFYIGA